MTPRDNDLQVQEALAGSVAGRVAISALARLEAAWADSAVIATYRSSIAKLNRWPLEQRFRAAALTIMWAALWHMALRSILPAYATSAFPLWTNVVVAAVASLAALCAGAVVTGWPHSGAAALWRGLRDR